MQTKPNTEKNITPPITCIAPWRLTSVKPLENYQLEVEFMDGAHGLIEMKNLIMSQKAGVFAALRDINTFNQVHLEYGTVTWSGEIDLAPDAMHDEIIRHGKWVVNENC